MKRLITMFALALFGLGIGARQAGAVPVTTGFTARIADANGPIDGLVNLSFKIYDAPTGGTMIWEEMHAGVSADQGLVFVALGGVAPSTNGLDASVFDGGERFLEITVNGDVQSPRVPMLSVPYAVHAATADTLGDLGPGDVARANHNHDGRYLRLGSSLACGSGQLVQSINGSTGNVSCAAGYGDSDAVAAMGAAGNGNSLNYVRYSNSEAVAAMGGKANGNPLNHARYSNAEAVAAMGAASSGNSLNHVRYSNSEAVAAMGSKTDGNPLNHARYADSEAVAAMGSLANSNPLRHNRYRDSEAIAAVTGNLGSKFMTYGPVDFFQSNSSLSCVLPGLYCKTKGSGTFTIYVSMRIPGPAILDSVECMVYDNDQTAGYDISLTVFHGSATLGKTSTSGASSTTQTIAVKNLNKQLTIDARGPTFRLIMRAASVTMTAYRCIAHYRPTAL